MEMKDALLLSLSVSLLLSLLLSLLVLLLLLSLLLSLLLLLLFTWGACTSCILHHRPLLLPFMHRLPDIVIPLELCRRHIQGAEREIELRQIKAQILDEQVRPG